MTWTYAGTPNTVARDAVRVLSGQNSSGDELLVTDEEITYFLAQRNSNNYAAAQMVCETLAAKYASKATQKGVGQLSISYADRSKAFTAKAKELAMSLLRSGISPYVGGQSASDRNVDRADTDLVQPQFEVGGDDNPRRGQSVSGGST